MTSSVIITTYNRAGHLKYGLWSLLHQKAKLNEILVVDDGSVDNTEGIVTGYQNDFPKANIRYIYNHNLGYSNCCLAKNIGLKEAKGDLLFFNEPEILYIGEAIDQHLTRQSKEKNLFLSSGTVDFVFSTVLRSLSIGQLKDPSRIMKEMKDIVVEWVPGYQPDQGDIAVSRSVCATYCASVRKEDLMKVGGWDERFIHYWGWDDIDLSSRLGLSGVRIISDPQIEVVHLAHGYTGCHEVWEFNKKLHEDPNKPIIANQGKEWGMIRKRK